MSPQDQPTQEQSWPSEPIPAPPIPPYATASVALPTKSTSADAIVAFILSLVSWAVCPIIFAVVSLIFAAKADRAISASPSTVGGSGLSLAAKLISWINIGFWVAVIFVGGFLALVLILSGAGSTPDHP
ncbi:MAG: hypothetical protein Q7K25_01620 [Actinomycetota bacterium]|nr:hypothetical protein [Actinomycetota bacterium]